MAPFKRGLARCVLALAPLLLIAAPVLIVAGTRGMQPIDLGGGGTQDPLPTPTPPTPPPPGPDTFYVRTSGDGSAPTTVAGAFDAADFNNAANWDTDEDDDGKIGPGDTVILLDDDGDIPGLTPAGSGTEDAPITIKAESGGSPIVDGAGATPNALLISGKAWLIVDGIHFEGGSGNTSGVVFLTGAGSDHNVIKNCTIGTSTQNGVLFAASAGTNNEIRDNTITGNEHGISASAHVGSASVATATIISGNTITANTQDGIRVNANFWTVTRNVIKSNGGAGDYDGVHVFSTADVEATGDNNTISYNYVDDQTGTGEHGGGYFIDRFSSTNSVYYNIAFANDGPGFALNDAPASSLYNNVAYGNLTAGLATEKAEFRFASTATDSTTVVAKNNIGFATAASTFAVLIDAEVAGNTLDITTNDWYRATGNWYSFNGTPGATLATWNALAAGIGTDISADPLFVNRYQEEVFSSYSVVGSVLYKAAAGQSPDLFMDVYTPPAADHDTNRCWGIGLHGGNYAEGNRTDTFDVADYAKDFAKRGWVFAAIDYTLLKADNLGVTVPEAARAGQTDALAALAYMRAHATQYGINPDCAFVMGFSSGSQTAAWTGFKYDDAPDPGLADPVVEAVWLLDGSLLETTDFVSGDPPWLFIDSNGNPPRENDEPDNLPDLQAASNLLSITNEVYSCVGCDAHLDLVNPAFITQIADHAAEFLVENMASMPAGVLPPFDIDDASPCIDAGTEVGLATDYAGQFISGLPDIGAYEGPPDFGVLEFIGGGHDAQGHLANPNVLVPYDTCTVIYNDANTNANGGAGSSDAGGNPACTAGGTYPNCTGRTEQGTFRQCVHPNTPRTRPRLVNFSVSGRITVHACDDSLGKAACPVGTLDNILIDQPYMTIDGLSAPAPGVTLKQANHGPDSTRGGAGQALLKYRMTHDIVMVGLRLQGHFRPYIDAHPDEVQLLMIDGDSKRARCSTWDDEPECPTCTVGVCSDPSHECGDQGEPLCTGNRDLMFAYLTIANANDEAGALWMDTDRVTRQHIFWYENFHPAGCVANGAKDKDNKDSRRNITDYGNVYIANGERQPKVNEGCYDMDIVNNFVYDWRNYSAVGGAGSGGYGINIDTPPNYGLSVTGSVFIPGHNGNDANPLWRPSWGCFFGSAPSALFKPCTDALDKRWCQVFFEKNLFPTAQDADHCITKPNTYTAPVRHYDVPVPIDPRSAANAGSINALIDAAGMPYPDATELAYKEDLKAKWLARATKCATDPKGCDK